MSTKTGRPIIVKSGNVQVRIYRSIRTKGDAEYPSFDIGDYSSGKRRLLSFTNEQQARAKANEIAIKLSNGERDVLTLSNTDRAAYLRALEILKPTNVLLELAVAQFAEAHSKLGGRGLVEAVEFFVRRNSTVLPRKTVTETYQDFIKAKVADGASEVYLKDLKYRVGKFAEDFQCPIASVDVAQVNEWLRSLKCGPRGRNNYRLAVSTMFKFAEAAGYLAKDHLDFDKIAKAREVPAEIEIFTPAEMEKLLSAAQFDPDNLTPGFNLRYAHAPGLLPLLVLGAFAGLRTAEIQRQVWEDINLERGFIRVTAAKGNTAQKRLVPVAANLKRWLVIHRRESGPVCEIAKTADAIRRLSERAGVKWKHNALRHSFISYRVALTQNIPQVSLEAGNSPKMIHRHYRELVTPDEAKEWFDISPAQKTNEAPRVVRTRQGMVHVPKRATVPR